MQPKSRNWTEYVACLLASVCVSCADAPTPELKPQAFSLYNGRYRRAWQSSDLRLTPADGSASFCVSLGESCTISDPEKGFELTKKICAVSTDADAEHYVVRLLCLETEDDLDDCETSFGETRLIGSLSMNREPDRNASLWLGSEDAKGEKSLSQIEKLELNSCAPE